MFAQTFKNIDDILHKDAGCTSELDYTEQSSWLLFLKYLDELEQEKAGEAALEGKAYTFILAPEYRWSTCAAPKTDAGAHSGAPRVGRASTPQATAICSAARRASKGGDGLTRGPAGAFARPAPPDPSAGPAART